MDFLRARQRLLRKRCNVHDISLEQLATKGDIKDLEFRTTSAIKDMQLRLGAMIVGLGAFLVAVKFFG